MNLLKSSCGIKSSSSPGANLSRSFNDVEDADVSDDWDDVANDADVVLALPE